MDFLITRIYSFKEFITTFLFSCVQNVILSGVPAGLAQLAESVLRQKAIKHQLSRAHRVCMLKLLERIKAAETCIKILYGTWRIGYLGH